jgi:hypothetical protein
MLFHPRPEESVMTALDARARLQRLAVQRMETIASGDGTPAALEELTADIDSCRAEYVALAVTEIASLRAHLSGPQKG